MPLPQHDMVSQLCGHTPLIFQGWASPLRQLDGASVLATQLDRCLIVRAVSRFHFTTNN